MFIKFITYQASFVRKPGDNPPRRKRFQGLISARQGFIISGAKGPARAPRAHQRPSDRRAAFSGVFEIACIRDTYHNLKGKCLKPATHGVLGPKLRQRLHVRLGGNGVPPVVHDMFARYCIVRGPVATASLPPRRMEQNMNTFKRTWYSHVHNSFTGEIGFYSYPTRPTPRRVLSTPCIHARRHKV